MVMVIRVITPMLSARYDDQQSRSADAAATATDLVHGLRVLQGLGVQSRARATTVGAPAPALTPRWSTPATPGISSA